MPDGLGIDLLHADAAALRASLEQAIEDLDVKIERRRLELAGRVADVAREAHEVLGVGAGGAAEIATAAGLEWGRFFMMIGQAADGGDQAARLFLRRWADAGRTISLSGRKRRLEGYLWDLGSRKRIGRDLEERILTRLSEEGKEGG